MKSELEALRTSIKTLTARVDGIEKSLSFISEKYESVLKTLKSLNQTTNTLGKKDAELTKIADSDREEIYKKRRNLIGKNINNLPSVQAAMVLAATSNHGLSQTTLWPYQ